MSLAAIRSTCHASFDWEFVDMAEGCCQSASAAQRGHIPPLLLLLLFQVAALIHQPCLVILLVPRAVGRLRRTASRRATKCVFANRRITGSVLESEHELPYQVCEVLLRKRMRLVSMPLLSKHKGHRCRRLRVRPGSGEVRISPDDCRQPRRRHCATCEPLSPNSGRNSLSEDSESYRVCGFPLSMPETNFLAMHQCTGTFPTLSKRATAAGALQNDHSDAFVNQRDPNPLFLVALRTQYRYCHTGTAQLPLSDEPKFEI